MTTNILVEVKPQASVQTLLYAVGYDNSATGTVFCMNQGTVDDKISIIMLPIGNTVSAKNYIAYQATINAGHSVYLQQLALSIGDRIFVVSSAGLTNFIFTGHTVP
jgi:hypothetical protein